MIQLAKVSAIYAALFAMGLIYLSIRVVLERRRARTGGDAAQGRRKAAKLALLRLQLARKLQRNLASAESGRGDFLTCYDSACVCGGQTTQV